MKIVYQDEECTIECGYAENGKELIFVTPKEDGNILFRLDEFSKVGKAVLGFFSQGGNG